jgi:hypothetical protein
MNEWLGNGEIGLQWWEIRDARNLVEESRRRNSKIIVEQKDVDTQKS